MKKITFKKIKSGWKTYRTKFMQKLGYKPLKEPKTESIGTTIKKTIRTRKGRELEAEIENIMFECKLFNESGEYAEHLNTNKKADNHFVTMWQLPRGKEYKDYKMKTQKFADALTAQVIIDQRKGNMMIEVIKGVIPEMLPYKFNPNDYIGKEYAKGKHYVIPVALGKDQSGLRIWELTKVKHLLICGVIGGGKSVLMKVITDTLLQIDNVELFILDFAEVDFAHTENHVNFGYTIDDAENFLNYLMYICNERRSILKSYNVENIVEFNKKNPNNQMKFKILLADEVGFTSPEMTTNKYEKERLKSIQDKITKLAISSRKYGIHMILGLQRPDHKFFPMMAKSQMPGKIAFKTENVGTSRTIIGNDYAYYLPNIEGRMLARYGSTQLEIQGMLIDNDKARERIVKLPPRKDLGYEVWLKMQQDMEEDEYEELKPRQRRE